MAVAKQQHSYQCDQCGSPNIVALPVLHEQGTRTYSSPTNWGSSQSYSAQGAAPPRRKGYGGPFLLWGFLLSFFLFWSWACYSAMLKYPKTASSMEYLLGLLGLMVLGCVIGLVLTTRKVSRYNRAVFPMLYSTWTHTYMCRRCGQAASYSFIIRVAAVEEQSPVGRQQKATQPHNFLKPLLARMSRGRRQIVFEFGWCSFIFARYAGAFDSRISSAVIEPEKLWHLGRARAKHFRGPLRTWQTAGAKGL